MATHPRHVAASLGGCATLFPGQPEPDPEAVAERALEALERGDHTAAFPDLVWVYTRFIERPVGRYALLLLAAGELDPGNAARRPAVGAELLDAFLALPGNPRWTEGSA